MKISELNIGDTIQDIEDGDCFYEGIIVSLNPIMYDVKKIFWNGIIEILDNKSKIFITEIKWYWLQVLKDGKFIHVEQ